MNFHASWFTYLTKNVWANIWKNKTDRQSTRERETERQRETVKKKKKFWETGNSLNINKQGVGGVFETAKKHELLTWQLFGLQKKKLAGY